MKVLPKHVFSIYTNVYKGIETPTNYVDGICINSDNSLNLPIGTKCIYSRNSKNSNYTPVFLPFPIRQEGELYDGSRRSIHNHLNIIGESALLYKHKMIYVNSQMKASDIDTDKIISDTSIGVTTTIVINISDYNIHFLNKLLKLPYEYASIVYSICGKHPEDYFRHPTKKSQVGITILNLNDCKPSFSNNYNGVGVKIKLYQSADGDLISIYRLFACLYSNSYQDLYFIDGLKTETPRKSLNTELEKANYFIKTQKKLINQNNKQKNKWLDNPINTKIEPLSSPIEEISKIKKNIFEEQTVNYTYTNGTGTMYCSDNHNYDNTYAIGTVSS